MDHGGDAARPTTAESTDLGMAGAVQGGEAHLITGTFYGQLAAAAARRAGFEPTAAAYHSSTVFTRYVRSVPVAVFHREPAPGVAYVNIVVFWRLPGPVVGVVLVGPQLPDRVMVVPDNDYGYSALQHRPGLGGGVVLADLLPGTGAVYSLNYVLQPLPVPGAGHGEIFVRLLAGGVHAVYHNHGAGYDGSASGALADDLGAVHDNRGMAAEHHRRLFAFVGIGASSMAVNVLAAGPGSPAVAFYLFALLLGGLFLVMLHVLCV